MIISKAEYFLNRILRYLCESSTKSRELSLCIHWPLPGKKQSQLAQFVLRTACSLMAITWFHSTNNKNNRHTCNNHSRTYYYLFCFISQWTIPMELAKLSWTLRVSAWSANNVRPIQKCWGETAFFNST